MLNGPHVHFRMHRRVFRRDIGTTITTDPILGSRMIVTCHIVDIAIERHPAVINTVALTERRTRYRRRGSVTKYSLETAETVKNEYEETNAILNQYRQGGGDVSTDDKIPQEKTTSMPDSFDFPIPQIQPVENLVENKKNEKKLTKGGRLRRFTMR